MSRNQSHSAVRLKCRAKNSLLKYRYFSSRSLRKGRLLFYIEPMLPVVEHFNTIQGEGYHSGKPSYFVRLGGCDVGCTWCDTKYSWPIEGHPEMTEESIVQTVLAHDARRVVITGGEPSMHDLTKLCMLFSEASIETQIETSGAHLLRGDFTWVTLSPKKFKPVLELNYPFANELKVVVFNKSDLNFALEESHKCPDTVLKYLQPEWSSQNMIPLINSFCKEHTDWSLSLQTHKLIDIS